MSLNPFQMVFGGSSQSTQSTSTPVNMNPLTGALAPGLTQLYGQGPLQTSTTGLTPSMTGAQETSLTNLAGQVAPDNNVNSYINNVLNGSYMPGGANGNPFLSATISAANQPIQESLKQTLSQTDPSLFSGQGQQVQGTGSSAFQNAQAIATEGAANAESANATQIANNAYNTGVSQMTAAANLQPQEVNSAINVLQAQLLPTLLQQQGITNGLTAFQDNVTSLIGFLQSMTQATLPVVGNQQQSTGTMDQTPGILPDITNLISANKVSPSITGGSTK